MPRAPRSVRSLLPSLVLLFGACFGDCEPVLPEISDGVTEVVIRPDPILTQPGATFTLEAVVKGRFGRRLDPASSSNLTLAWWDPEGVLANTADNPATVTVPNDPGGSFQLRATVTDAGAGGSHTSNTVDVTISPVLASALAAEMDTNLGVSDWILAEHPSGNPPEAALVQAQDASGDIVGDWSVGVVGHVRLGREFQPPAASQPSEVAIFARGRHAELRPDGVGSDPGPWKPGQDKVDADPLESAGGRYLSVVVGVEDLGRVVQGVPVRDWVRAEAEAAFDLLDKNRVGLELEFLDVFEHDLKDPATGDPLPAEVPRDCGAVDTYIPGSVSSAQGKVLYVLYAPDILATSTATVPEHRTGWACRPPTTVGGEDSRVIFLSWAETFPVTLTHELGHVLSLTTGLVEGASGHVNGLEGFDHANVMWSASGLVYGSTRAHLTLGQIYRMNAHEESWANTVALPGWGFRRACQRNADRGVCPALAADLRR